MMTSATTITCAARTARSTAAWTSAHNCAGATLIELLISLALLVAITAIVAPNVIDRLGDHAMDAAVDSTERLMLLARSHAQASGEAVEVMYDPVRSLVIARLYAIDPDDDGESRPLPWSWAALKLPRGVSMTTEEPRDDEDDGAMRVAVEEPPARSVQRLTIFLPDGSVIAARPLRIMGENDRVVQMRLNPWTGLPATELADLAPADERR